MSRVEFEIRGEFMMPRPRAIQKKTKNNRNRDTPKKFLAGRRNANFNSFGLAYATERGGEGQWANN